MDEIKQLQELIDQSSNIVFFGGAGVSTESGIKDFRGKDGLYKEKYKNYSPEYMLSIDCLINNTDLFFDYYKKNMNTLNIEPNITHRYLAKLEEQGKLKAIVTQNIDGLHQRAGSKKVLEVHGTTYRNYCMKCKKEYPYDYIFKSNDIPKCECGGTIRPDVTLYGEMLPEAYNDAITCILNADLLIVAGTSLTVQPASGLIDFYKGKHLVIINNTPTPYDDYAELVIHKPLGEIFSKLK
ncbi:MAG: NAD-dependent protein deacylase [Bacilli bacterium]|nr:NAD-dependent protein deacylase [Bacilli bacterium]